MVSVENTVVVGAAGNVEFGSKMPPRFAVGVVVFAVVVVVGLVVLVVGLLVVVAWVVGVVCCVVVD